MNLHRVRNLTRVAAGEGDADGDAVAASEAEDESVAAAEAIDGEREAAELVFTVRIGAGDVEDEVGMKIVEGAGEVRVEDGEIVFVAEAIGEIGVESGGRPGLRIIVLLMNGESEDRGIAGKNGGGTVAVVDVGVDDHGSLDGTVVLEAADGDGDVVDDAEAFAVVGEGVMEAAADVGRRAGGEGALPCFDRAARGEPDGFDEFFRVRNFHAEDFVGSEGAGLEFADVGGGVDAEDVFVGGGSGGDDVRGRSDFLGDEGVADEAIFLRGKNVGAEVEVVAVVVDEWGRQSHDSSSGFMKALRISLDTSVHTPTSTASSLDARAACKLPTRAR